MTCSIEITRLLLTCSNVLVDEKVLRFEETALHYASKNNMAAETKLLLDRGAEPDSRNYQGWSPLNFAVSRGNSEIVRLLLDTGKVDVNVHQEGGRPPLAAAIIGEYCEIIDMLISYPGIRFALDCDSYNSKIEKRRPSKSKQLLRCSNFDPDETNRMW